MNEAQRKRAAQRLGIPESEVSVDAILDALDSSEEENEKARYETSLVNAREKLSAHAERGAIPVAALDAVMKQVEEASTAEARDALAANRDEAWCLMPDDLVPRSPNGSGSQGAADPNANGNTADVVSGKIGDRVAKLVKETPTMSRLDAYNQAVSELSADDKKAYEDEEQSVLQYQRGG